MLELKNISKRVEGDLHIDDVSLRLEKGSLNVLLGPTLSGKTSLMRIMAGLDQPTNGAVYIDGVDVTGVPVQKRNVAMVYQQFINYPALSVYENIASPLRIAGKDRETIDREVKRVAQLLRLEPYLDRKPLNLSGGQQQRTALARAIVKNADLVLLDEPLANLDYKLREELREELPKIFSESGAIFVYATTEPTEALLLGGNTATLSEGRITQYDETVDVYRAPRDLVTAQTFSDPPLNVLQMAKKGDVFELSKGITVRVPDDLREMADTNYTVGFRPHHLSPEPIPGHSVALDVRVRVTELTGSESFVHIFYEEEPAKQITWVMLTHGIHDFDVDQKIQVYLDTRTLMVFDLDGRVMSGSSSQIEADIGQEQQMVSGGEHGSH